MFDLLSLKEKAFGLDISDSAIRVAQAKKTKKGFEIVSLAEKALPPGLVVSGRLQEVSKVAAFIKAALKEAVGEKITTPFVALSLPEESSFLQIIQLPLMKEAEAKKAAKFQAENFIPLSLEQVYFDAEIIKPLNNHLNHLDVLIVAFPKNLANSYLEAVKAAGLIPKILEVESIAISRALIKNELSFKPVMIIDFGANRTRMVIFSGRSVRLTSAILVGSRLLTEKIAQFLNLSFEEAEKMKLNYGFSISQKVILKGQKKLPDSDLILFNQELLPENKIAEALVPPLVDLLQQLKRYLNFYQTRSFHDHLLPEYQSSGVEKVILSGGGSNLKGFSEFLSSGLNLPVELGNPLINFNPPFLKSVFNFSAAKLRGFATALGLALRGALSNDD
jgi:type IV pilus assembly protein PilM